MSTRDRILLDRYASRDSSGEPKVGSIVIVTIKKMVKGVEKEERDVGVVVRVKDHPITSGKHLYSVKLRDDDKPEKDWKVLEDISRDRFEILLETSYFQICDRMVSGVAKYAENKGEFLEQLRQLLREEAFVPAGRIWAGVGKPELNVTLFNCFVKAIENDSSEAIAAHWGNILNIFRRGGGCGWNLSVLRYAGAPVLKSNGRSSGVCSWATNFAMITATVQQGGSRRGASMQCLAVWHPDALDFMAFKNQFMAFKCPSCEHEYEQLTCPKCANKYREDKKIWEASNISLLITKDFMDAVEHGLMWDFVFPDTTDPDYDEVWNGDLEEWKRLGKKIDVIRSAPAREVWRAILKNAHETGDPGLLFVDRANEYSNSWYYAPLISTNPCVTGATRLHTQYGMVKIKELAESKVPLVVTVDKRALDAKDFGTTTRPAAPAFMTRKRAEVFRVTTKAGYDLEATAWHDFYTKRGKVKLKDLCLNDELLIQSDEGQFGSRGNYAVGRLLGLITGDGHINSDDSRDIRAVVSLWGGDRVLARSVADDAQALVKGRSLNGREYEVSPSVVKGRACTQISSEILARVLKEDYEFTAETKLCVPEVVWCGTRDCVVGYLRGLFQMDGSVASSVRSNTCSVRLSSSYPGLMKDVQRLLANLGIYCTVYKRRSACKRSMPDGKGGYKLYKCKASYELVIDGESRDVFMRSVGFLTPDKNKKYKKWVKGKALLKRQPFRSKVVCIESIGVQPVYDTTQEDHNTVIFNGLVTGQCAEQWLPKDGICNLSHINLGKFLQHGAENFPEQEQLDASEAFLRVDHRKLEMAVRAGVRFLDIMLDLNKYHDADMEVMAKSERRIGLGILGYGELLCRLGLRYGSRAALDFTSRLFAEIKEYAYQASIDLAKEKGPFPCFKAEPYLQGKFVQGLPERLRSQIGQHGIRNVTVLTVAPTGSVGSMVGTSTGIEPYIHRKFTAKTRIGTTEETINIWEELSNKFGSDSKKWPSYIVTSNEISVRGHIETQAVAQVHVDSSISKTVNLPNSASIDDVEEAYLLLYKLGCKGGTIYRDGSKAEQVLYNREDTPGDGKVKAELMVEDDVVSGDAALRPKIKFGYCASESLDSPVGSLHPSLRFHPETGEPYDFFLEAGKGDVHADAQAMARLISVILRWPDKKTVKQSDRLQIVMKQLFGIHGASQRGIGPDAIFSQPDAIAKFIARYLAANHPMPGLPMGTARVPEFIAAVRACRTEEEAIRYVLTGCADLPPESKELTSDSAKSGNDVDNMGHHDLCPACNNATFVRFPGHCSFCINQDCQHSEC